MLVLVTILTFDLYASHLSFPSHCQDEFGETALIATCGHDHVDVAGVLISRGAVVNFKSKVQW